MKFNKWILGLAAVAVIAIAAAARAQTNITPTVQGGVQQIIDAFKSGTTNVWGEAHGLYAPGLQKKYGGGVGLFWNLSDYVYTGVRLDYVDGDFWMPSGNATLQVPFNVTRWLQVAPLGYAGIGVPVSGAQVGSVTIPGQARDNNGQPTAILGYGAAIRIWNTHTTKAWLPKHVDLIGDSETWTGFKGQQYRFGLTGNWTF